MKSLSLVLFMIGLISGTASAQSYDACHVYLIDVEAARRAAENFDPGASKEAQARALSTGVKVLGEFRSVVAEEELTTRNYAFPQGWPTITASVYYTDESMPAESMMLGIAVSDKALEDALSAPNAALAEVAYKDNTSIVRVKKLIEVKGRAYLVGLECDCSRKSGAK